MLYSIISKHKICLLNLAKLQDSRSPQKFSGCRQAHTLQYTITKMFTCHAQLTHSQQPHQTTYKMAGVGRGVGSGEKGGRSVLGGVLSVASRTGGRKEPVPVGEEGGEGGRRGGGVVQPPEEERSRKKAWLRM